MNKRPIYYGYIIVAAATVIMVTGYGPFYSYSVFFNSLSSEFNLTKGTTSGIFSIAILVSGLISIFIGRASDRLGSRAVCTFCGSAIGLGLILMALVTSVWQVYLLYGTMLAAGAGGLFPSAVPTVARWFTGKRGMMTGIVTAGVGIGSAVFSPFISYLISTFDWRKAYIIVGIVVLVSILSAAQFLRREPEKELTGSYVVPINRKAGLPAEKDFTYRQAIRTGQFWMLFVIYFCFGYCQSSLMVHIVPRATGLGISEISAATVLSVMGAASILGRLIMGGTGDRIRVKPLFIAVLVLLFISLVGLIYARNLWALLLAGIPFGMAYGSSSTIQPLAIVELFGLNSMGALLGSLLFSVCIGGALGPLLSGIIFDVSNSYQLAFAVCSLTALAGLILILWLTPPKKR
jgi:OFA family oxalate/formate antiporter-like MFS transporter